MRIEKEGKMGCPYRESTATSERRERTEVGYRRVRCRICKRVRIASKYTRASGRVSTAHAAV